MAVFGQQWHRKAWSKSSTYSKERSVHVIYISSQRNLQSVHRLVPLDVSKMLFKTRLSHSVENVRVSKWVQLSFSDSCTSKKSHLVIIKSQAELRSCTHRISPFSPWSWTTGFSASTLVSPVGASPAAPGDDTQATRRSTKNVWRGKSEENVSSARVVWVQCWKRVWCWHDTTERKLTWNGTTTPQRYPASNLWGVPCEEFSILFSLSPGVGQLPKPGLRMMCTPQARLQHHRRPQSPAKFQKRSPNIQKHPHIPEKMSTNHQIFPRSLMIFEGQGW